MNIHFLPLLDTFHLKASVVLVRKTYRKYISHANGYNFLTMCVHIPICSAAIKIGYTKNVSIIRKIYAKRTWILTKKKSQRRKVFIAKRCGAQFAVKVTHDKHPFTKKRS